MTSDERTLIRGQEQEPTILMPTPGGQATVTMRRSTMAWPAASSKAGSRVAGLELQRLVAGINPLLGAAGTLLGLVAQLRSTTSHDDPVGLRAQLLARIADFEAQATANGVPRPKITAARYLLCSFIDEVIEQTPWSAGSIWDERNLLQQFHEERWGGEKAFQLLERLGQDPGTNADLLELFYVCLQLGFEGRYRGTPDARTQLAAIANGVLEVIRPARDSDAARTLAVQWQGAATHGHRDVSVLPLWALLTLAGAMLLGIFLVFNNRLDALAQPVFRQIQSVPAALRLDRGAAAAKPRLAPLLKADVGRGALRVRDEAMRSVVMLPADALFVPGSAQLDARRLDLLGRVAGAIRDIPGQVAVIGHTDDVPVSSPQFPSNWHLSRARAQAVLAALVQQGARSDRLHAEGRADAEPLAPGSTPAQRAHNRRIEIELRLPRPDG